MRERNVSSGKKQNEKTAVDPKSPGRLRTPTTLSKKFSFDPFTLMSTDAVKLARIDDIEAVLFLVDDPPEYPKSWVILSHRIQLFYWYSTDSESVPHWNLSLETDQGAELFSVKSRDLGGKCGGRPIVTNNFVVDAKYFQTVASASLRLPAAFDWQPC